MPRVELKGIDELIQTMTEASQIPDDVIDEMLNARADVIVAAQREEAQKLGMGYGETTYNNTRNTSPTNYLLGQKKNYTTGTLARSIKKGKIKNKDGKHVLYITPVGRRSRGKEKKTVVRNAEIAFLNEYGTRTINARNFLRTANEKCADAAVKAEAAVYDRWLKEKGL